MQELYREVLKHIQAGEPCALVTCIKEDDSLAKYTVDAFWLEQQPASPLRNAVEAALSSGCIQQLENACEYVIVEPFLPPPRLLIFGGGHVALPLCEFAQKCGFLVTVMDDRPFFANQSRFPLAQNVVCDAFENAAEILRPRPADYAVIVTRGHRHDGVVLRQLLGKGLGYVGMIGSHRRVAGMWKELEQEGFSRQELESVCSPIGLSIGAVMPEEIAVSILAELIQYRRRPGKQAVHADLDVEVLQAAGQKQKTPCAMLTIVSSKGSVPRGAGAKMLSFYDGRSIGSIGGGCSEADVVIKARDLMQRGSGSCIVPVDMTGDVAESEGMVCGGVMDVLVEVWPQ